MVGLVAPANNIIIVKHKGIRYVLRIRITRPQIAKFFSKVHLLLYRSIINYLFAHANRIGFWVFFKVAKICYSAVY